MMRRKRLIRTVVVLVLALVLLFVYKVLTTSSVVIISEGENPAAITEVTLDGRRLYPSGSGAKVYKTRTGRGKHTIVVAAPGYESTQLNVATGLLSKETVTFRLIKKSADAVAQEVHGLNEKTEVSGARLFANNWLVYFVTGVSGGGEGSMVVAKYVNEKTGWTIVDEGTYLDTSLSQYADAPPELINYMRAPR